MHRAALDDSQWLRAATLIDEACQIKGNMLAFDGRRTDDQQVHVFLTRFCHRGQRRDDWEREYYEVWHPLDERVPRINRLSDGQLVHVTELYTPEELKTSPVYNEVLRTGDNQNSLNTRMDGPNGSDIVWAVADPAQQTGWSTSQIELIRRLLPHIRQYVLVRDKLAGAGPGVSGTVTIRRPAGRLPAPVRASRRTNA